MQWRIVVKDGRIVEVTEVVGVEGSRVIFERYRPPHDTVPRNAIVRRPFPGRMRADENSSRLNRIYKTAKMSLLVFPSVNLPNTA